MGNSFNISCCESKEQERELAFPSAPGTPIGTPRTIVSSLKNRSDKNTRDRSERKTVCWAPTPKEVVRKRERAQQSDDTASSEQRSSDPKARKSNESSNKHIPVVRSLNLRISRDFEGSIIELEDSQHVMDMIDREAKRIQKEFDSWSQTERRIFKTHYNSLVKGATYLGNILVSDTSTFKDRIQEMSVMSDPVNL